MGREIRRVPPNWEHPKNEDKSGPQPMFNRDFEKSMKAWLDESESWDNKTHQYFEEGVSFSDFCGAAPKEEYHKNYKCEDATWFQVYETISEGTPVSPPFETEGELVDYLVEKGDFWDQETGEPPWSKESAEQFVKNDKWRPTMIIKVGVLKMAKEGGIKNG